MRIEEDNKILHETLSLVMELRGVKRHRMIFVNNTNGGKKRKRDEENFRIGQSSLEFWERPRT